MRWFVVLGLLFAALGTSTSASAAGLGGDRGFSLKDDAPFAPPFSWTGVYVGAQIGWGWADTDARSGTLAGLTETHDYNSDGLTGGFHIGYNLQNQGIVYGVEADVELSDINGGGIGSPAGLAHQTDVEWLGSMRARVGYTTGRSLLYLTGGWAFGGVKIRSQNTSSYTDTRHGWTLGTGYEYAFANNMTARLEYRYTDLGQDKFRDGAANLVDESDVRLQAVRAGISLKF